MAYQNVGTPRFYIDSLNWIRSLGLTSSATGVFNFNPSSKTTYVNNNSWKININSVNLGKLDFFAMLGHNSGGVHAWQMQSTSTTGDSTTWSVPNPYGFMGGGELEVNYGSDPNHKPEPEYHGFTIGSLNIDKDDMGATSMIRLYQSEAPDPPVYLGCLLIGRTYTMPHSPDLNLSLSYEYGGTKTIETKGGASLSNNFYHKPPSWGNGSAWELYEGTATQNLARSGRRMWDLSFSYLQDSSVFPDVSSLTNYEVDGYGSTDSVTENTLLDGDDFFSRVIHKTMGGTLPFIFQPDNSNNNPDQFAICKFDMNSFKFDQVANGVYNVKLKIREVW